MFGWTEGNTVNRFQIPHTFSEIQFAQCNFKMFDLPLVVSAHINAENAACNNNAVVWIAMIAPLKTEEEIKHSLNCVYI